MNAATSPATGSENRHDEAPAPRGADMSSRLLGAACLLPPIVWLSQIGANAALVSFACTQEAISIAPDVTALMVAIILLTCLSAPVAPSQATSAGKRSRAKPVAHIIRSWTWAKGGHVSFQLSR